MFWRHLLNLSFNRICSFLTLLIEMSIRPITTCGKHYHRHFLCLFRLRRGGLKCPHTPLVSPKANPFEVPVSCRTRGAFGLSCRLVVVPLLFSVLASHTDGVGIVHRHRPASCEARAAPVAILLRKERIHLILLFVLGRAGQGPARGFFIRADPCTRFPNKSRLRCARCPRLDEQGHRDRNEGSARQESLEYPLP